MRKPNLPTRDGRQSRVIYEPIDRSIPFLKSAKRYTMQKIGSRIYFTR